MSLVKPRPVPGNGRIPHDTLLSMPPTCKLIAKRVQGGGNDRIETNIYLNLIYDSTRTFVHIWTEGEVVAESTVDITETHKSCIRRLLRSLPGAKQIAMLELVDGVLAWRMLR